jgi:hypothetical protein
VQNKATILATNIIVLPDIIVDLLLERPISSLFPARRSEISLQAGLSDRDIDSIIVHFHLSL